MSNIAYVRVSTLEQNESRQIEALEKFNIDKWFTEKVSGKDTNRPQLQLMIDYVREGDTVYIHDFSRLARNTKDLLEIIEKLNNKGVTLVSNKESIDTSTPQGKLMVTMIGAIYEFELSNLHDRQKEGIAIAKSKNVKFGRPLIKKPDKFDEEFIKWKNGEQTAKTTMENLNLKRSKFYMFVKQYENEILISNKK